MKNEVFLDTSYAIALSSPTDTFHFQAVALAEWFQSTATLIVTTRPVMFEIGNALSKPPYRLNKTLSLRLFLGQNRCIIKLLTCIATVWTKLGDWLTVCRLW